MLVHCPHCQRSFDAEAQASAPLDCVECRKSIQTFKWLVRDAPGLVTVYNTISLLKIGILANAVAEQDELSKSGRRWLPIASIPELARLFRGADADPDVAGGNGASAPPIAEAGAAADGHTADAAGAADVAGGADADEYVELGPEATSPGAVDARSQGTERSLPAARSIDGLFDGGDAFVGASKRRWPWLLLALGLLSVVVGWFVLGAALGLRPDREPSALTPSPTATAPATGADPAVEDVVDGAPTDAVAMEDSSETSAATADAGTGDTGPSSRADALSEAESEAETASDSVTEVASNSEPDAGSLPESAARRMARQALAASAAESPGSAAAVAPAKAATKPRPASTSRPKPKSKSAPGDGASVSFAQWMKQGDSLLSTAPSEALNAYIHAYSLDPWGPQVLTRLGDAYLRLGDNERAVSHYQRSTGKHPQYGPAFVGLGEALIARGDPGEARRVLAHYLERFPEGSQRARASGLLRRLGAVPPE